MDLPSEIEKRNLVSQSLFKLLLGDPDDYEAPILQTLSLPKLMYDICIFYSSLIQMRLTNLAISKTTTVYSFCGNGTKRMLSSMWNGDDKISSEMVVFSFLVDCIREDVDPEAFCESSITSIRDSGEIYDRFLKISSVWNIEEYKTRFISLLESLPLLSTTEIDVEEQKIRFNDQEWVDMMPFMFIMNNHLFLTSSVSAGEQNNQIALNLYECNCPDEDPDENVVRVTVYNNEYMTMLCSAFELKTVWYDQEEYLGNCTFVVRLSEVLASAVQEDIASAVGIQMDIMPYVRDYFTNSAIRASLDKYHFGIDHNGVCGDNNYALQNIFMGLIVMHGAFYTTHDLVLVGVNLGNTSCVPSPTDTTDRSYADSEALFLKIIDVIKAKGYSTLDVQECVDECMNDIETHLDQLKGIVPVNTRAFQIRADHIHAEHMSRCILQLLGVDRDNLFTDQETMLSIHDFLDMIHNRNADIPSIFRRVISFVIKFYSTVTGIYREVPNDCTPADAVRILRDYCIEVSDNRRLTDAIGRNICDTRILDKYIRNLEMIDSWNGDGVRMIPNRYFMISYAHNDSEFVKETVRKLREQGYNIHIDEDRFDIGDHWKHRFISEINNENCVGVLAFLSKTSVRRKSIAYELQSSDNYSKNRGLSPEDAYRFVIHINMEKTPISDWMGKLVFSSDARMTDEWMNANECMEYLNRDKIFIDADDSLIRNLEPVLRSRTSGGIKEPDIKTMNPAELAAESFLTFLKTGRFLWLNNKSIIEHASLTIDASDINHCVFPLLLSVKETRIKRDSITILSYDLLNGKSGKDSVNRVMLSSSNILADDYYCIPNIKSCGECGEWMANPLLVSFNEIRGAK